MREAHCCERIKLPRGPVSKGMVRPIEGQHNKIPHPELSSDADRPIHDEPVYAAIELRCTDAKRDIRRGSFLERSLNEEVTTRSIGSRTQRQIRRVHIIRVSLAGFTPVVGFTMSNVSTEPHAGGAMIARTSARRLNWC